ncbi:MAG: helix-turn-helix domain-containing protein [Bacteroidales bacterium]|nr:helix-turn-helix domain-containing protein [Bacteroidales bacterium]
MADNFKLNERLQLAFDYLFYTGRNVFLTGKAGTGKTTFLKQLKESSPKRMIVTSPTGVAAVNAGGVTLHSFFQLPLGPQIPGATHTENRKFNFQKTKIDIIRSLELLVIDEISMVRADLLDSVDAVLRRYRGNDKPFGGVQMLLIGDMQQLSPVVRPEDEEILKPYYETYYFFGSKAWAQTDYVCIELNEVFRQSDSDFISILNEIRECKAGQSTIEKLNRRYIPNFQPPEGEDIVTLVTTNYQAERINQTHLLGLKTAIESFDAEVSGDFPESAYPVEKHLVLKKDSVVMFLKNDPSPMKEFYNGKIGRITGFEDNCVIVKCKGDADEIKVSPLTWDNTKYTVNSDTKEITEEVVGTFKQIPLKTAWAVTIHKSQGLTFDKLMIDASNSFAHGQVYVALSRCRSLEGLILLKPLSIRDLIYDNQVNSFSRTVEEKIPDNTILIKDKRDYYFDTVQDLFDFKPIFNTIKDLQRQILVAGNSVAGNFHSIDGIDSVIYGDMIAVSEKFLNNIRSNYAQSLDIESETTLSERIRKGCKYYLQKLKDLTDSAIESFDFVCDDKNKRSKIAEAWQRLDFLYNLKKTLLEHCQEGLKLKDYYAFKAEKTLGDTSKVVSRSTSSYLSKRNSELFMLLTNWREQVSDALGIEEKDVVSSKTIVEISQKKPHTLADLLAIKGMGGKAKRFAVDILKVISSSGVSIDENELQRAEYEALSTHEKTFFLFNSGRSVQDIARDRNVTKETILGHLSKFVVLGQLEASRIMDKEKISQIRKILQKNPQITDKQIVTDSDGKISYGEIKIVRAEMSRD